MHIGQLLSNQAYKAAGAPGVIEDDGPRRTRTYGELDERATRLANWLHELQPAKSTPVAVMLPNSADYVEALFGIARAGHVSVHVNTKLTADEVAYILSDSGSKTFIVAREFLESSPRLRDLVGERDVIVVDRDDERSSPYEEGLAKSNAQPPDIDIDMADPFFIGYTSGTTGQPKGAVISHRSRVMSSLVCALEYELTPADRQLMMTPMYHGGPMIFVLMAVMTGHPLYTQVGFEPQRLVDAVQRYGITTFFTVPTILKRLADHGVTQEKVPTLNKVISNAAALPTAVKERFLAMLPESRLWEAYGSTEASWVTSLRPPDQPRKEECCGHPMPLVEVVLLDDDGNEVGVGEVGELYARGPLVFDGYLNRPDANAESIRPDGYVTVGDLARRDEENYLYIVDRKKDMIISGGVNIYPREIEEVLMHHPDVADVAVLGERDPEWGERVVAAVAPQREVSEKELDAYCREHLAAYKRPRRYVFVDSVPRSVTGKILKKDLRGVVVPPAS